MKKDHTDNRNGKEMNKKDHINTKNGKVILEVLRNNF